MVYIAVFPTAVIIAGFVTGCKGGGVCTVNLTVTNLVPLVHLVGMGDVPVLVVSSLVAKVKDKFTTPLGCKVRTSGASCVRIGVKVHTRNTMTSLSDFVSGYTVKVNKTVPKCVLRVTKFGTTTRMRARDMVGMVVFYLVVLPTVVGIIKVNVFTGTCPLADRGLTRRAEVLRRQRSTSGTRWGEFVSANRLCKGNQWYDVEEAL